MAYREPAAGRTAVAACRAGRKFFRTGCLALAPMTKADAQLQRLLAECAGCALHQLGYFCNRRLCFRMPTQLCVQLFGPTLALVSLRFLRHAPPVDYQKVLTPEKSAKCN